MTNGDRDATMHCNDSVDELAKPDKSFQAIFHGQQRYNGDHNATMMVPMNWPNQIRFQTIFHGQPRYNGDHDATTMVPMTWSHQIKFAGTKLFYNISLLFFFCWDKVVVNYFLDILSNISETEKFTN